MTEATITATGTTFEAIAASGLCEDCCYDALAGQPIRHCTPIVGDTVQITEPTSACLGEIGTVIRVVDDVLIVRLHGVGLSFGTCEVRKAVVPQVAQ